MNTQTLLLPSMADKHGLLHAFARHCQFSIGFGNNWDALWDALNDWLALQSMPLCLQLDGSRLHQLDACAWQQCLNILDDACALWPEFDYCLSNLPDGIHQ